jgi:hypothetical protein
MLCRYLCFQSYFTSTIDKRQEQKRVFARFFPYFAERFFPQIFDTGAELVMIFARISLFGNLSSIF